MSPLSQCQQWPKEQTHHGGSSITGAVFNLTNSIVGAGIIGLGGAIATSGGLVSIVCIVFFAGLAKISFDMVISLSSKDDGANGSYEQLGKATYGQVGLAVIVISKFVYSFGCMVAYLVIIKENFPSATMHLVCGSESGSAGSDSSVARLLDKPDLVTFLLSAVIMLPLCLLRDMTPLEKFSAVKILAVLAIVVIVACLYLANPNETIRLDGGSVYQNWFEIRPGLLQSVGTFVFTFVAQHTINLTYNSLRDDVRNMTSWRVVSSISLTISTVLSLGASVFLYMTFWEKTTSDMFSLYPPLASIDVAKLLLCVMMMFTYPLPLFSCRELIVVSIPTHKGAEVEHLAVEGTISPSTVENGRKAWWLLPNNDTQMILPFHVLITMTLWFVTTELAIRASSLGDVLNLVGCIAGTMIGYVLPALFYFKMVGYSHIAMLVLVVGTAVGLVGTFYSMKQLINDSQ